MVSPGACASFAGVLLTMKRPLPSPRNLLVRSLWALSIAVLLAGCRDPNAIGIQDYGTITGTVFNSKTHTGILNAFVVVGSQTSHTDSNGYFTVEHVPIGTQTVTIYANGYKYQNASSYQVQVNVLKDQTSKVDPLPLDPV